MDMADAGRMCPQCHNPSTASATSRTVGELFWIPLIPLKKHDIWKCTICQWEMRKGEGPDPQRPGAGAGPGPGGGGYNQGHQMPQQGQYGHQPPPPQGHQQYGQQAPPPPGKQW